MQTINNLLTHIIISTKIRPIPMQITLFMEICRQTMPIKLCSEVAITDSLIKRMQGVITLQDSILMQCKVLVQIMHLKNHLLMYNRKGLHYLDSIPITQIPMPIIHYSAMATIVVETTTKIIAIVQIIITLFLVIVKMQTITILHL